MYSNYLNQLVINKTSRTSEGGITDINFSVFRNFNVKMIVNSCSNIFLCSVGLVFSSLLCFLS